MVWAAPAFQSRRLIIAGAAQTMRLNFALGTQKACVADCASETLCASHSKRSADHAHVVTAAQPCRARRTSKYHARTARSRHPRAHDTHVVTRATHARRRPRSARIRHARSARTSARSRHPRAHDTHVVTRATHARRRPRSARIRHARSARTSARTQRAHVVTHAFKQRQHLRRLAVSRKVCPWHSRTART